MKYILTLFTISILFCSCSKSNDNEIVTEPNGLSSPLDSLEKVLGIIIKDKAELTYINHFINSDSTILSISTKKDEISLGVVYNLNTKSILFDHAFTNDPDEINKGYGENIKVERSWLEIGAKSNTHLYGERVFQNLTNSNVFRSFIISEIKSNKIVESDLTKASNHVIRPWFDNTVLIIPDNKMDYQVIGDLDKTIIDDRFKYTQITGTAVSLTKTLDFNPSRPIHFLVQSLYLGFGSLIEFNPKDNFSDRVQVKSITSNGEIATVVFILTSFENKIIEKTVKVDFVNQKII